MAEPPVIGYMLIEPETTIADESEWGVADWDDTIFPTRERAQSARDSAVERHPGGDREGWYRIAELRLVPEEKEPCPHMAQHGDVRDGNWWWRCDECDEWIAPSDQEPDWHRGAADA